MSLFAGLLLCAECGKQMQRSVVSPADKSYSNFVCSTYKKFGKSVCSSHLISEEVISEILISSLNLLIKSMIDADTILAAKDRKNKGKRISKLETEISILSKKQIELKGLKTGTYSDLKLNIITNDEYKDIISFYNKQIDSIDDSIQKKKELLEVTSTNQHQNDELFVYFNKYKGITKLTRAIVCDLVDSITVDNERNVVINYRFGDDIKEYLEFKYN